jgi:hypothetical protein
VYARLAAQSYGRALKLEAGNTTAPPKLALVRQMFGAPAPDALPAATPAVRKAVRN